MPPTPPKASTAQSILGTLSEAGGYIGLAIQLGGVLVPIGKALISKIKGIGAGSETITYQLLIEQDQAELQDVDKMSTDDLTAINAELARMGLPALPTS
jgi:hypothetical protein